MRIPPRSRSRIREYPKAKEDSKNGGDGSPQWIVNMWAMMWGSKRPTPGKLCELYDDIKMFATSCIKGHIHVIKGHIHVIIRLCNI